jgi:hypothetical protein
VISSVNDVVLALPTPLSIPVGACARVGYTGIRHGLSTCTVDQLICTAGVGRESISILLSWEASNAVGWYSLLPSGDGLIEDSGFKRPGARIITFVLDVCPAVL